MAIRSISYVGLRVRRDVRQRQRPGVIITLQGPDTQFPTFKVLITFRVALYLSLHAQKQVQFHACTRKIRWKAKLTDLQASRSQEVLERH